MRRIILAVVLLLALTPTRVHAAPAPPPTPIEIQYVLRSNGWAVPLSGVMDARTVNAVKLFQKFSGLRADGIVGPITSAALGLDQAVRLTPPTGPPPEPSGFAPEGLSGCAEADWYVANAGLPSGSIPGAGSSGAGGFDSQPQDGPFAARGIAFREAGCQNGSHNSCCGGYLGVHAGNLTAPGYAPLIRASCGVVTRDSLWGETPQERRNNVCVGKVIYDYWLTHSGPWPWRL